MLEALVIQAPGHILPADAARAFLLAVPRAKTLARLTLRVVLNDAAAAALGAALEKKRFGAQLAHLDLRGTELSDAGAASLAAGANGDGMVGASLVLDVGYCRIGPDGLSALAAAVMAGGLQGLDVAGNPGLWNAAAVAALQQAEARR